MPPLGPIRPRVAGVDGTKGGWVAVTLEDGRFSSGCLIRPAESNFAELQDAEIIAINVAIGFEPRQADAAARTILRGAAASSWRSTRISHHTGTAVTKIHGDRDILL